VEGTNIAGGARTALRFGVWNPRPAKLGGSGAGLPRSSGTPLMLSADSSIATVH
jgi:hypothetical protein